MSGDVGLMTRVEVVSALVKAECQHRRYTRWSKIAAVVAAAFLVVEVVGRFYGGWTIPWVIARLAVAAAVWFYIRTLDERITSLECWQVLRRWGE